MSPTSVSRLRVRYAETDQMGVAWHGSYFAWFEVGRTELLRERGMTYRELEGQDLFLPVIEARAAYSRPARYDDELRREHPRRLALGSARRVRVRGAPRRGRGAARDRLHRARRRRRARQAAPAAARAAQAAAVKAVVTGAAGFIGSHLAASLLEDGHEVLGVDCFTDYYPRPVKEQNLAPLRGHARFRLVEERLQDAALARHLEGAGRRVPPRGPGGRAGLLGPRVRPLHRAQRARDAAAARGGARGRPPARRVRLVVLGLRRRARAAAAGGRALPARLALRGDQARGRAPRAALPPQPRPRPR